jgi:hypothetical protein
VIARNEYMTQQKVAQEVLEGEDKIMEAMQRFANDSRCLTALKGFQGDVQTRMVDYRRSLIESERNEVINKAQRQLAAILNFEESSSARLHESVV